MIVTTMLVLLAVKDLLLSQKRWTIQQLNESEAKMFPLAALWAFSMLVDGTLVKPGNQNIILLNMISVIAISSDFYDKIYISLKSLVWILILNTIT